MPNKIKIIFMGTPDYATSIFDELLKRDGFDVLALFTQPDKEVGRKKILTPPHIKKHCTDNNLDIPIYQPQTLRDENTKNSIIGMSPDFIIVAAYGQILPKSILDIAPCINLHASLLPKYRGASPIHRAILNNDSYTGVTAMLMDEGLDTGDILGYRIVDMSDDIFIDELFDRLAISAKILTINILNNFHKIIAKKQINTLSSHTRKIQKENGKIDFLDAKDIYTKYRAFKFWPSVFLENGLKLIKIQLNEDLSINKNSGEIKEIHKDHIVINCLKGSLKIYELQPISKKQMPCIEYINGKRIGVGDCLL